MRLGAEVFSKSPSSDLKLVVNHQDTMPKRKRWNPWRLTKNLTKATIVASVAMVFVKMILAAWYK